MKRCCLNAPGIKRGNSEIGWIHPQNDGCITFTFIDFCILSSWVTLDLPACLQILVHPSTGGWMKSGENWGTILCCEQREKGRVVICQIRDTQSGLNSCTFSSFHSTPGLVLPWWYVLKNPTILLELYLYFLLSFSSLMCLPLSFYISLLHLS